MSARPVPTHTAGSYELPDGANTRISGPRLLAARISLITFSAFILVLYVIGTPSYYLAWFNSLHTPVCLDICITPANVQSLHALGISITIFAVYWVTINLLFALTYFVVAILIFWRKSDDWMALFASFTLVAFGASFPAIPNALTAVHPAWSLPITLVSENVLGFPSLIVFFFLFPTGRFVPRWTRWVAVGFTSSSVLGTFFPDSLFNVSIWPVPLLFLGPLLLFGSLVFAQVYRYRHISTPMERQQTKWVVFGAVIALLGLLLLGSLVLRFLVLVQNLGLLLSVILVTSIYLLLLLIPLSLAIAILRYRLWDIDGIIQRTLVYATLSACVIGLYVLVVVGLGSLLKVQDDILLSLLVTGLIAVLFQPLRQRLQQVVNRLLYGERDDPYAVLARLSSRLEATLLPETILPTIVETVAQTLKLPYVAIALLASQRPLTATAGTVVEAGAEVPDIAASYGRTTPDTMRVPLVYQAETIGYLLLAARAGETFDKTDARLLADLARQAGVAVYAGRLTTSLQYLTESLQQAREHLVTMREEERRRLRRDLHDGLGPTLASLTFKVDAARNLLTQDSERADTLLVAVRQQAQEAITEIRRLVYNLRPPALDELGLLSALREQVALYQHQGLEVAFDAPGALPYLPAAVEVAVYRIAQEALTNVARHAKAQHCLLRLAIDAEAVHLDIGDDGKGVPAGHRIGVGLHTMHERASELGGNCTITEGSSGGTTIRVRVPLAKARDAFPSATQEPGQQQQSLRALDVSQVRQEG